MTLEEQLKDLPEEFTMALEYAKDLQLTKVIDFALKTYEVKDDFDKLDDETKTIIVLFMKHIYNYGFYGGVSFAIDPDTYIEDNDIKENGEA